MAGRTRTRRGAAAASRGKPACAPRFAPSGITFLTRRVNNQSVLGGLSQWFDPDPDPEHGTTPDYRFSLANERTFLAWVRTGLALIAGGLACSQFLPPLPVAHLREIVSIVLLLLGGLVALRAVDHWARAERAMRLGTPLPRSRFPAVLAIVVALGAVALVIAVLVQMVGNGR